MLATTIPKAPEGLVFINFGIQPLSLLRMCSIRSLFFFWPHSLHMEVPKPGSNPSHSWECGVLNPLGQARDWTHAAKEATTISLTHCATVRTPVRSLNVFYGLRVLQKHFSKYGIHKKILKLNLEYLLCLPSDKVS